MENIELYFLRSFEAEIAKQMLFYAARLDEEQGTLEDHPQLSVYIDHYGIYKTDIGVYALVDSKLAGAAWVRLIKNKEHSGFSDGHTPELVLAVKPQYRNQGIATKIMEQLFTEASRSFSQISLTVRENSPVLKLYEKLGFEILEGSHNSDNPRDQKVFTMIKKLVCVKEDNSADDWYQATQKWRNDIY